MRIFLALSLIFMLAILPGCKQEEDYQVSPTVECGDTLMSDPHYRDGFIQFKMNDRMRTVPFKTAIAMPIAYSDAVSPPNDYEFVMEWSEVVDSVKFSAGWNSRITIIPGDTMGLYHIINPENQALSINYPATVSFYVAYQDLTNPRTDEVYTSNTPNPDATFEITSRSPVFTENGKTYFTVQGVFCCNLLSRDDLARKAVMQGNFNGRIQVY